jgi:hypothetical protein
LPGAVFPWTVVPPVVANTTNSTNVADIVWSGASYQLPTACSFSDSTNSTVDCSTGVMNTATFTFTDFNLFWSSDLNTTCTNAQTSYTQCLSNTIITNMNTCLQETYYDYFMLANDKKFYGIMQFDSYVRGLVYGYCSSASSFAVSENQFTAALEFPFGTI